MLHSQSAQSAGRKTGIPTLIMCGIAGWFGDNPGWSVESMLEGIRHRGPDACGTWQAPDAVLIHARLSVIDLSEGGRQPMTHGNGPQVLCFNGEIYNHAALRAELEATGETFSSSSDTEVLLRLLCREGAACLPRLQGMFAFAFWDGISRTGLLVRDSLGIKPLYWRAETESGTVSFASESRVLKRRGDLPDATAIRNYFLWGSVPEPETIHQDIRMLEAGHLLRWSPKGWNKEAWHRPARGPAALPISHEDAAPFAREALRESLERHLVSDAPLGLFLSGGIDSTAVLALTREILGPKAEIRTFSVGFEEARYDESETAGRTAEHFGATHHTWMMTADGGVNEVCRYLEAMDQPTIDGFNTWCVSKMAREAGIKVVLSGLGGDELFAGYPSFARVPALRSWHGRLGPFRQLVAAMLKLATPGSPWRRLASFLEGNGSLLEAYHAQRGIFTGDEAKRLASAFTGQVPDNMEWDFNPVDSQPCEWVSELETTRYMRNQLLRDSDVFSMAHGLELRVPLVDQLLMDTLRQIPALVRLQQGKQLLLDAVPEIPEWVRNQPKRGFRFPFQEWMEKGLGDMLQGARSQSAVPLTSWYRSWSVAALRHVLAASNHN